ncbi:Protein of unknown function [Bacillus cereus]|uniref:Uncharacterized protein n=1 Tax=Bacillus wiedmannii TaxID=1890302 RepID=A0A1C3Z179_9BACI|nr:Protein of unknown function [Bacillus wiedmannii]SCB75954.1 Protein of unknown function [Bacillus cereus]SCB76028.1 Protein of unknown function [Bacillus mobilis]SCB75192.1 Protein of unknown function [Bacillus wiedmannii]SCM90689.1 Protein of unknown function [Bacillus cereus]
MTVMIIAKKSSATAGLFFIRIAI